MDEVMDLISNEISNEDSECDTLETSFISLKDFSKKVHSESEKSPYLYNIIYSIIKKSSYCWLLDQSDGRVSTGRLKRFIGSTRKTPKKTPCKNSKSTLTINRSYAWIKLVASSTSTVSSSDSIVMELDDSDDLEEFSDEILSYKSKNVSKFAGLELHLENYYAVFYDQS